MPSFPSARLLPSLPPLPPARGRHHLSGVARQLHRVHPALARRGRPSPHGTGFSLRCCRPRPRPRLQHRLSCPHRPPRTPSRDFSQRFRPLLLGARKEPPERGRPQPPADARQSRGQNTTFAGQQSLLLASLPATPSPSTAQRSSSLQTPASMRRVRPALARRGVGPPDLHQPD
ncbi:hypothetical protein HYPSUDRAFT_763523 [Hypholoma sublateritium FD-334 SS-4]|uniref:Uncharacterized protein n=1 Tax=Hypholoma sublateritium (strain FD-334 SS-4) TaxID=945553 RepID=A0A0D2NWQ7_HYPSF|nr:hypothetical protein HYPSUDRAFT_763523 [Hypholoma sublateritium FD-334 SS-4]